MFNDDEILRSEFQNKNLGVCHFYLASVTKLNLILNLTAVVQAAQVFLTHSHLLGGFWLS